MSTFKNPFFILAAVLFSGHQALQKILGIQLGILDSYLDPLLLAPLLGTALLAERRWLWVRGRGYVFSTREATILVLTLALVSEVVFPRLSPAFVADPLDALAIMTGGFLFFRNINRPLKNAGAQGKQENGKTEEQKNRRTEEPKKWGATRQGSSGAWSPPTSSVLHSSVLRFFCFPVSPPPSANSPNNRKLPPNCYKFHTS